MTFYDANQFPPEYSEDMFAAEHGSWNGVARALRTRSAHPIMKLAYLVFGCLPMFAQTSAISSVTKSPGDKVTLEIVAKSDPKRAPVALHWDVIFPEQLMEMVGDPEAGSAALKSGKSLQCRVRNPHAYGCVLSGGPNLIADGQIAIFHFRIRTTAVAGKTALRIERAVTTTVDSKILSLDDTEAIVIIR